MKPRQLDVFAASPADLPLFSGTAPRAQESRYQPAETSRQPSLFACPYCSDTGYMDIVTNGRKIRRPCNCKKGNMQP